MSRPQTLNTDAITIAAAALLQNNNLQGPEAEQQFPLFAFWQPKLNGPSVWYIKESE